MFDGVTRSFVETIRLSQARRQFVLAEVEKLYRFADSYTDTYRAREKTKLVEEANASVAGQLHELSENVAAKIAQLDEAEAKEAELRALDSEYLARLNTKLDLMDKVSLTTEQLKPMLAEFENDPVAIACIKQKLGDDVSVDTLVNALPDDNTGKKQKHIKRIAEICTSIANKGIKIVGRDGLTGATEVVDVDQYTKALENAFVDYCMAQDDDFSLDDEIVLDGLIAKNPELEVAYKRLKYDLSLPGKEK